jgi:hypothetical protein
MRRLRTALPQSTAQAPAPGDPPSDGAPGVRSRAGFRYHGRSKQQQLMDEAKLLEKLRLIEALFEGAATDGERDAAAEARKGIQLRLKLVAESDPPVEYRFRIDDAWSRKVFTTLCRRYDIHTFRYRGQRRTTLMAKVSKRFVNETQWPEFEQISSVLRTYLDEVTDRVIATAIHQDTSEAPEVVGTPLLPEGAE